MAALSLAGSLIVTTESLAQTAPESEQPRHHAGGRFRNNYPHDRHGLGDFFKFLGDFRKVTRDRTSFPLLRPDLAMLAADRTRPTITWIGHDTFLLQVNGLNILTDPHFSSRASPVSFAGPERAVAPALSLDDLPHIDVVLISHNHYDHLDEWSVVSLYKRQRSKPPHFFVPLRVKQWFAARNIDSVTELDWWQSAELGGLKWHAVPVQHFSSRGPFDRNATLWCGWVGETPGFRFIFAGDSGYSKDFRDIHARFGPMDLSLIPIGAYEPRWFMRAMHVNPEEAVKIHQDLESRLSIAMHWGTFKLTLEPLDEPPRKLAEALAAAKLDPARFVVLQHGETRSLGDVVR